MALGRDTFAGDLLHGLGIDNVLAESPERYPKIEPTALPEYDVVVLPDEPYAFSPDDGPEAFDAAGVLRLRAAPDLVRAVPGRGAGGADRTAAVTCDTVTAAVR